MKNPKLSSYRAIIMLKRCAGDAPGRSWEARCCAKENQLHGDRCFRNLFTIQANSGMGCFNAYLLSGKK